MIPGADMLNIYMQDVLKQSSILVQVYCFILYYMMMFSSLKVSQNRLFCLPYLIIRLTRKLLHLERVSAQFSRFSACDAVKHRKVFARMVSSENESCGVWIG